MLAQKMRCMYIVVELGVGIGDAAQAVVDLLSTPTTFQPVGLEFLGGLHGGSIQNCPTSHFIPPEKQISLRNMRKKPDGMINVRLLTPLYLPLVRFPAGLLVWPGFNAEFT